MTDPRTQQPPQPQHGQEPHRDQPMPNPGTAVATDKPIEQERQQPIPNQQEEDEKLIEYLQKEEGYVRPAAESELARDREGVKNKKKQHDQDQKEKDQQAKDKDQQGKSKQGPQQEQQSGQGRGR